MTYCNIVTDDNTLHDTQLGQGWAKTHRGVKLKNRVSSEREHGPWRHN